MTPPESAGPAEGRATRREVWAWAGYDWANSAYSTLSITLLVLYIQNVVFPQEEYGTLGAVVWAWGIALSMLVAAVLSPIVGAIADAHASKRSWLAWMTLGGAGSSIALSLVSPQYPWLIVAMFVCACLFFELSLGFYNGFLPEIADERSMNRISAWGYGLGYVGGGLALVVAVVVLMFGGKFGLPDADSVMRDYNASHNATFEVEVPDGTYDVAITSGDAQEIRQNMWFQIEDVRVNVASSPQKHFEKVERRVVVSDGRLSVVLGSDSGERPVTINELTVQGVDVDFFAPFDFGNSGSPSPVTHIWVSHADTFRSWSLTPKISPEDARREWDQKREKKFDPAGSSLKKQSDRPTPSELAFGWSSGTVTSRDAVTPTRLRIGLFIMGAWWGLFALPTLLVLRDRGEGRSDAGSIPHVAVAALKEVRHTLGSIRSFRMLAIFLVAFLFYNDGVQTVLSQSSTFAIMELDFTSEDLIGVILMIQFLALPGAIVIGWLAGRLGQKPVLMFCLAVWIALLAYAYTMTHKWEFWVLGVAVAVVMGGTQSVSRAIMGTMTPKAHAAEFFGFFNLSGKATSFMGTFLFGAIISQTGSGRYAIISLLPFFVLGLVLISKINVARGRREALGGE
jgi:MFS-type transporter involved in bile tolerance (Atg22 family)